LVAAFPDAEAAFAATAARVAHAAALIDEAGAADAATVAGDDGLDLVRWPRLSPARQRQSLVAWLRREFAQPANASLVERLLRARAPGDRFQAGPRRPARSLKLQYQARGVAPALRHGPIVCRPDGIAVFVPGLGIDARALAAEGETQVSLAWLPDGDSDRAAG